MLVSLFKLMSLSKVLSLYPMGLLNGRADPTLKDLPEQISRCNLMGPCSARLITHSIPKSVDRSALALYACSMLRGSAIVAHVLYAHSVKKTAPPPSNRDG